MKKLILTTTFLIFSFISYSQNLEEKDIIGHWIVSKIINSPNDHQFKGLADGFKNATFSFYQNKKLNISTNKDTAMFHLFTEKANTSEWVFDKNSQRIKIGNSQNRHTTMGIIVKQQSNKVLFQLDQTELLMEMNKQ